MATADARGLRRVQHALLTWYAANARDLPWRQTRDPYAILVAEVMLQQTQVERVIPKWQAWLDRFPTLVDLARASRSDAIRQWQGLGYNLRAVRLHAIACQVVAQHGGVLPSSLDGLMALAGVGRYTAGAVACFAYEQPVAMVDTNIRRVLGRVFGVDSAAVAELADAAVAELADPAVPELAGTAVPPPSAYTWNQALMDLGATLCRAQQPLCLVCPLLADCGGPRTTSSQGKPAGAFRGSSRYYRGRAIDALRTLAPGSHMALSALAAAIAPESDRQRVEGIIRHLADDGLLVVDAHQGVRLAD